MPSKADIAIREATPSDARALNAYMRETFATADHLITRPDEYRMGWWRHRHWIAKKNTNPYETCLLAMDGDAIVGALESWTDRRARIIHCTCFSMSVKNGWRCRGVGTALLKQFIDWVKNHPTLEKIELHVHSDNEHALKLYAAQGFKLEGTRKKAIKYEDGRIIDDHMMALWP